MAVCSTQSPAQLDEHYTAHTLARATTDEAQGCHPVS